MLYWSRKRVFDKTGVSSIRHAGLRWEFLPGGDEFIRAITDWSFLSFYSKIKDRIEKNKSTRMVFPVDTPAGRISVKVMRFDKLRVHLRSIYGRCQARKEWENHIAAHSAGLPTVRAIALGELRRYFGVREAVVITKWEAEAENLVGFRRNNVATAEGGIFLEIASSLGRLTARVQNAGIYHNEIKPSNVLIKSKATDQLLLIDWKHARMPRPSVTVDLKNIMRAKSLFDREWSFSPMSTSEWSAFFKGYYQERADNRVRSELVGLLRKVWPNVDNIIPSTSS